MAVRERPTWKQAAFARAYVEGHGNGTAAVFKAGYKPKNSRVANVMAVENLSKPIVQAEIKTWQQFLEAEVMPSLNIVKDIARTAEDPRVRLAASKDLLNRAGVGKSEAKTNVLAVFANMDETKLLENMAQLSTKASGKVVDVSDNV
jgi:hypothetical protein